MKINRIWAMPNKWTFKIKPIKELIKHYMNGEIWVDPFAGENSPADITNDIEGRGNKFNMDGLEFLKTIDSNSANGVLFDPPYSVDQCLRKYTPKYNGTAGRIEYRTKCKDEIGRIIKRDGISISFSWDSTGIGIKRGFEIVEILLICHGACHNDTIITVERKIKSNQEIQF
ncbi:MAG TPA: adenine-specific DNA methylase [bacterium]|nr:adenine-specific DNA methylase [bacterium]